MGQVVRPLDAVGCYVPGGRYPLVSTLLMTVIPAQVAGVKNIRVVSPKPSLEVLAAAAMLGVAEFYRVGGAQAIAALAYGAGSIARVDKIVGPGNAYVTVAKKLVSFDCAIDFLAGPTEAVVLSDSGVPEFIAADLVAQAEHDPETLAVLITTSRELARSVSDLAAKAAKGNQIAKQSLRARGVILVAASRQQGREWANRLAAEHITVEADDLQFIQNAGSIFVGDYSAQAAGDYASGPNHVLPTSGQARFRGGLSVADFMKVITVQQLSAAGLKRIAPAIEVPCNSGKFAGAWAIDPREVRTCLIPARRCARSRRTTRRWRAATGCVWISTRTRWDARRECLNICNSWGRSNLPDIRSANRWKQKSRRCWAPTRANCY